MRLCLNTCTEEKNGILAAAAPPAAAPSAPAPAAPAASASVPKTDAAPQPPSDQHSRVFASPMARRLAELKNIRLGGKFSLVILARFKILSMNFLPKRNMCLQQICINSLTKLLI